MMIVLCILLSMVLAENRLVVFYKNQESAERALSSLHLEGLEHVQRSNLDPTITIWQLSPFLSDHHVELLIENLKRNPEVEEVERETLVYPSN